MADGLRLDIDTRQAVANLKTLEVKARRRVLTRTMTRAAKPLVAAARAEAPVRTGALRSAVRVVSTRFDRRTGTVSKKVGVKSTKAQRKRGKDAYYVHFVTGGTRPHTISARDGALLIGGAFRNTVQHPGARKNDFMLRASDKAFGATVREFSRNFGQQIEQEARRLPKT